MICKKSPVLVLQLAKLCVFSVFFFFFSELQYNRNSLCIYILSSLIELFPIILELACGAQLNVEKLKIEKRKKKRKFGPSFGDWQSIYVG